MSGIEPLVIGLAAAGAAAGAGVSAIQSQQQNKAIGRAKAAQREAASVQSRQVEQQAANERRQLLLRQERIRGAAAVSAGATGVDLGDFDQVIGQTTIDTGLNLSVIDQNLRSSLDAITSNLNATNAGLNAQRSNIGLSALSGGLSGFTTGLSIGNALSSAEITAAEANRIRTQQATQVQGAVNNFMAMGAFP